MRITPGMTGDNAIYNLQKQRAGIETLQEQLSSGMLVNRPSDDPLTARQIVDLQNQIAAGEQYSSNITKGELLLNIANTALSGMAGLMQQVKKIAGDVASGITDATAISGAIGNLTQLKQQIIDLGNTRLGDQYIFGGFSDSQPFDANGNFSGTDDLLEVEIAQGSQVSVTLSGGLLLRGGTPPAAVGSGATAGTAPVDLLGSIDALIGALSVNDRDGIADGVKNLKAAGDQVASAQADVAGRLVRLDNMKSLIENNQNTMKTIYGDLQNVDYAKAGVQLSQMTTAFNAALSATAKLTQLSLMDYME